MQKGGTDDRRRRVLAMLAVRLLLVPLLYPFSVISGYIYKADNPWSLGYLFHSEPVAMPDRKRPIANPGKAGPDSRLVQALAVQPGAPVPNSHVIPDQRQSSIKSQFAPDGSHMILEQLIIDWDFRQYGGSGYRPIKTVYEDAGDYLIVKTTYDNDKARWPASRWVRAKFSIEGRFLGVIDRGEGQ